jgi:hypothetical protein
MVLFIWFLCGVIGYLVGEKKGRPGLGAALGFCLGIFGLIIIAVMGPAEDATKKT